MKQKIKQKMNEYFKKKLVQCQFQCELTSLKQGKKLSKLSKKHKIISVMRWYNDPRQNYAKVFKLNSMFTAPKYFIIGSSNGNKNTKKNFHSTVVFCEKLIRSLK